MEQKAANGMTDSSCWLPDDSGRSWAEWVSEVEERLTGLADELTAQNKTTGRTPTTPGGYVGVKRPDGLYEVHPRTETPEQSDSGITAEVTSWGGGIGLGGFRSVQHWQLRVNGRFVADTSLPRDAELFREIAARLNESKVIPAEDHVRELCKAGHEVINAVTAMALSDQQRHALIKLGDAIRPAENRR